MPDLCVRIGPFAQFPLDYTECVLIFKNNSVLSWCWALFFGFMKSSKWHNHNDRLATSWIVKMYRLSECKKRHPKFSSTHSLSLFSRSVAQNTSKSPDTLENFHILNILNRFKCFKWSNKHKLNATKPDAHDSWLIGSCIHQHALRWYLIIKLAHKLNAHTDIIPKR